MARPGSGRWPGWLLLLPLAACTGLPVADYAGSGALPAQLELATVPFYPQETYQCGPAALATVLDAAGAKRTPDELIDEVYLPQRRGSLQFELLAATRRSGLLPYPLEPRPDALLQELAAGHPVLVLQDMGWPLLPQWHYAVVVGYDLAERTLILRSGRERRQRMSIDEFDRNWAKAGRWAFVALPPGRLPAGADEARYVSAAIALEKVAPAAAGRAYAAALERWPMNLAARMGSGNAAYKARNLAAAEAAYRQASIDHPGAADAWNNLAQTLHERGRQPEALAAAQRAVDLGGPREGIYAATLALIRGGAVE